MGEMSKKHIKYAQDAIHKFIWSNKPAKVKHSTLIGTFEQGGLRSIDMETMNKSLRLAWLARLLDDNDWNNIATIKLKKYGGLLFLLRCNYEYKTLNIPPFYKKAQWHPAGHWLAVQ